MAGSMTRTVPSSVQPSATFTVTYTVSDVSGNYFVSVVDTVTGGCTPIGEHSFFIADDYAFKQSESFTYTAPSSGNCVFHGDYKFGSDAIVVFSDKAVNIEGSPPCVPDWVCGDWGTCVNGEQSRTCNDGCGSTTTEKMDCSVTECGDGVCEGDETVSNCPEDCEEPTDICKYFEFAKSIDEEHYCTWGIGIVAGAIVLFILLLKK